MHTIKKSKSSTWPIDRTLLGNTTLGPSEPGSNDNEGILRIPQSSSISGAQLSDCLMPYTGHSLGVVLALFRDAIVEFYSPSRLGREKRKGREKEGRNEKGEDRKAEKRELRDKRGVEIEKRRRKEREKKRERRETREERIKNRKGKRLWKKTRSERNFSPSSPFFFF